MKFIETLEWSNNRIRGLMFVGVILIVICVFRANENAKISKIEIVESKTDITDVKRSITSKHIAKTNEIQTIDINHADSLSIVALPTIGGKITSRILKFRKKMGGFKNWAELSKVYGLENSQIILQDHIVFGEIEKQSESSDVEKNENQTRATPQVQNNTATIVNKKTYQLISINSADSSVWESLPGIGAKTAGRIIKYRQNLGGFYALEQIKEIYGLSEENYLKFSNKLQLDTNYEKIDLQLCSIEILGRHPYCGWKMAKIIIAYREQHHGITWTEIEKMPMLDHVKLEKLKPYVINS